MISKVLSLFAMLPLVSTQYQPTWKSLDSRPLPPWYDEAKFGIFMHWGVYSVPSFGSEWFWYRWKVEHRYKFVEFMKKNYPPNFEYADFAPMFKAEFFDPNVWAEILAKSGARYVVLTTKHHEGWTNWKSNVSWNWNSVDNGPHRDLVGEFSQAIRKNTNITLGLYHSLYEWFHPFYRKDVANNFTTRYYVKEVLMPELYDLINSYKPDYLFADGPHGPVSYWGSLEFLAWLYNESPVKDTIVTNDRWCDPGCKCLHGGTWTCKDHYNPGVLQKHKWENAMNMDKKSWGFRRNMRLENIRNIHELLYELASTVSCGGNLLLNVGPTADGRIVPIFEERLLQMGEWLSVNGEAIYSTKPWRVQNDTITKKVWYTSKPSAVYAIVLEWPSTEQLTLGAPISTEETQVTMLGYEGKIVWKPASVKGGLIVMMPGVPVNRLPSQWAWVLKLQNVE